MRSWIRLSLGGLILLASPASAALSADPPLITRLLTEGLSLTEDVTAKFPRPRFVDDVFVPLADDVVQRELAAASGPHGLRRFTRKSTVAPIAIEIDAVTNADGKRVGHLVNVAFVVHQRVSAVRQRVDDLVPVDTDEATVDDESGDPAKVSSARTLTDEELASTGVELNAATSAVRLVQFPLLDRVIVRAVMVGEQLPRSDGDAALVLAWALDSRFSETSDTDSGSGAADWNVWMPIDRDDAGRTVIGDPAPYRGVGGYLVISPVPGQADASIVQSVFVLHEPIDWFAGRNQLRSKLPLILQDRIRDLRREIEK